MCIGNSNSAVTAAIKQVADMYDVRPISGTLMHQMKQYVIDGKKMILLKELEQDQQKVEACTFETGEVYAIDIAMSTGDGKPRDMGMRTTVYKRAVDQKYALKNQASRAFFNEVNKRYPTLPFSTRSLPDEKAAKLGVRECVTHGLMLPYPVLHERKGDFVAHTKFTVLLLPNGTLQITGLPPVTFNALVASGKVSAEGVQTLNGNIGKILFEQYQAEHPDAKLPENIAEILNEKKPENKKKAKKMADAEEEERPSDLTYITHYRDLTTCDPFIPSEFSSRMHAVGGREDAWEYTRNGFLAETPSTFIVEGRYFLDSRNFSDLVITTAAVREAVTKYNDEVVGVVTVLDGEEVPELVVIVVAGDRGILPKLAGSFPPLRWVTLDHTMLSLDKARDHIFQLDSIENRDQLYSTIVGGKLFGRFTI